MYPIWFERPLLPQYTGLIDGIGVPTNELSTAQAAIAGSRTRYDGAWMERARHLKVISRTGIGLDNIDVPAATQRGIVVCNAPDAPTIGTAEHTIALLFAVARNLKWTNDVLVNRADRTDFFAQYRGLELLGRTLGVVGLGRIGSHVAGIALGIGMRVIAYDPLLTETRAAGLGVDKVDSLETLLRTADAVSLHLPLTPATRNLIGAEQLARMKPGAILINAARGGLVDEQALLAALDAGRLFGAGLDVFETEPPPPDHPLLGRADVVVSPHIASATDKGKDRLWITAIEQAIQVLQGEWPENIVNPEVKREA